MITQEPYTYEQYLKDMRKIFPNVQPTPHLVTCLRCDDTVKADEDCSCGHIKKEIDRLKERVADA